MLYNELVRRFASKRRHDKNVRLTLYANLSTRVCQNEIYSAWPRYSRSSIVVAKRLDQKGELCYNVHHVEKNGRNRGDPWSLRQIGIYHQINLTTRRSSWIFMQPPSIVRDVIFRTVKVDRFRENPMLLHIDILSSITKNWPYYIEDISSEVDELVSH